MKFGWNIIIIISSFFVVVWDEWNASIHAPFFCSHPCQWVSCRKTVVSKGVTKMKWRSVFREESAKSAATSTVDQWKRLLHNRLDDECAGVENWPTLANEWGIQWDGKKRDETSEGPIVVVVQKYNKLMVTTLTTGVVFPRNHVIHSLPFTQLSLHTTSPTHFVSSPL